MVGRTLNNRYQIEQLIGSGGMADVFRATDTLLGRTVAVKVLHQQYAKDPVFVERFKHEAQAAANLNQANIVNVYDWGIEDATYYIVLEFVEGRDLKDIIVQGGALLPERAVEIAMAICNALEAAHANGIVHRDIKPQNIIVTADNQIKVMDFGIARTAGGTALTQTGTIMGTAQYISPEQAQGRAADPRSDLYSLGVVLYEMLTGRVPFDGENPVAVAYKHVREDPLPPSLNNPDISPELEAVVMKALAKNPANRYQNAMEMQADLARCLEGNPVFATPVLPPEEAVGATQVYPALTGAGAARRKSRAWLWILLIIILLGALGAGVYALIRSTGGIEVPDVVGKKVDEATGILEEKGLALKVAKQVVDPEKPPDTIISQDPKAGGKLSRGQAVEVVVSKGQDLVLVPDLTGLSQTQAESKLEQAGLRMNGVSQQSSAEVKAGLIISQSPAAGSRVPKNTAVSIVISKGPEMVTVPNVVNMTREAATQRLETAGFKVEVQESPSTTVPEGTVTAQEPAAGESAPKGSTVTITVAKRPAQKAVPDVVGKTAAAARMTLEGQGFVVNELVDITTTDPSKAGKVASQSPAGGDLADEGSTVTIHIYKTAP